MLPKNTYTNGQKVREIHNNILTYFFKDGKIKAKGLFINEKMEGERIFYRGTGQVRQVANFKNNQKDGLRTRYDKENKVEYQEIFKNNKLLKR